MRMSQLVGRQIKETPRDAQTPSHIFLLRGGYVRPVSAGIYSLLPLARRIVRKIEEIIRQEMNAIDGQEILMPVVLPAELWEESGRYESVGQELLRFEDRNEKKMLLGMTHEEAVVHLCRTEVNSYRRLPVMLYQIQTKYRDEARPRAGLIRVREFTMKDGYSFHTSQADLDAYYERAHAAYERIFARLGMDSVMSILSDTGMMGGSVSHEFMAISDSGEDIIFTSPDGSYRANRDIATAVYSYPDEPAERLEKVATPGKETIDDVAQFLGRPTDRTGKAVFYRTAENNLVFAMIRGDIEVNETKLKNFLGTPEIRMADDATIRAAGAVPGYASPMALDPKTVRIVVDPTAAKTPNLIVGANEAGYHYTGFNFDRDLADTIDSVDVVDIATVRAGDTCPVTGDPLEMKRGIEVGNIFQLGTKYTESMNCRFLDENGVAHPMIMGCYGIGVGRAMAAVIEQSHDEYGPIWPISIAPFELHVTALNLKKDDVAEKAEALYRSLVDAGIDVLYDDRDEKAGSAFADADLIGVPLRIVVSPKTLADGVVEFKHRGRSERETVALGEVVAFVADRLAKLRAEN